MVLEKHLRVLHLDPQASRKATGPTTNDILSTNKVRSTPTRSYLVILSNGATPVDQALKCMSLWGRFSFIPPEVLKFWIFFLVLSDVGAYSWMWFLTLVILFSEVAWGFLMYV